MYIVEAQVKRASEKDAPVGGGEERGWRSGGTSEHTFTHKHTLCVYAQYHSASAGVSTAM